MTRGADAAVQRAIAVRQREAAEEVERILAAALAMMEKTIPEMPRVSDIVAAAGSSNKAFYRYFGGKDDLIVAVMERGVALLVGRLDHQMGKHAGPVDKLAVWIRGVLAQTSNSKVAREGRAVSRQLALVQASQSKGLDVAAPIRDLLAGPVAALGSRDVEYDVSVIFEATMGVMHRHLLKETWPEEQEVEHLVRFCVAGVRANQRKD